MVSHKCVLKDHVIWHRRMWNVEKSTSAHFSIRKVILYWRKSRLPRKRVLIWRRPDVTSSPNFSIAPWNVSTAKCFDVSTAQILNTYFWRSQNIPLNSWQFWTRTPVPVIIIHLGGIIMVTWRNISKLPQRQWCCGQEALIFLPLFPHAPAYRGSNYCRRQESYYQQEAILKYVDDITSTGWQSVSKISKPFC